MSNPTATDIERALQLKLEALAQPGGGAPDWQTKKPGIEFKPGSAPWQRGTWMPGTPDPVAYGMGAYHRQTGVYQIDLFYPKVEQPGGLKRVDRLLARAEAFAAHFYPANGQGGQADAGGGQILFDRRPLISRLDESDASFNRVFVEIYCRLELPPG